MRTMLLARSGAGRFASVATSLVVACAVAVAAASPASAAKAEEAAAIAAPEVVTAETGLSDDAAGIAAAAEDYSLGDASGAAALVDAAAADEAGVIESASGDVVAVGEGATLETDGAGAVLTDGTGLDLGIAVADAPADAPTTVVDGVAVTEEALPATDVVTRAVDGGVQMVAVLADESASTNIDFDLTLPEGAQLEEQWDGSIAVQVLTETVVYDAVDEARFDAEIEAIVGDTENPGAITDEQWAAIDAVEAPTGESQTVLETVATVAAPWAVDANGVELDTTYELSGTTLTQVVTTDDTTSFPVVADPRISIGWALYMTYSKSETARFAQYTAYGTISAGVCPFIPGVGQIGVAACVAAFEAYWISIDKTFNSAAAQGKCVELSAPYLPGLIAMIVQFRWKVVSCS